MAEQLKERPSAAGSTFTIGRRHPRRAVVSAERVAVPSLMPSRRPRRSRRRSFRRFTHQLLSPLALTIILCVLAAGGAYTWMLLEERRLERQLAVVKVWPTATVDLRPPAAAALRTYLDDSFLHYDLTVSPSASSGQATADAVTGVDFVIRLLDKDGFTVLVIQPIDALTINREGAVPLFNVTDVVGCSPEVYASASSWTIEWAGREPTSDAS